MRMAHSLCGITVPSHGRLVLKDSFGFGANVSNGHSANTSGPCVDLVERYPVESAAPTICAAGMVPSRIRTARARIFC